jgi:hypothetical protein
MEDNDETQKRTLWHLFSSSKGGAFLNTMFFPRGLKHNIHQPFCRKTAAVYFFASVD